MNSISVEFVQDIINDFDSDIRSHWDTVSLKLKDLKLKTVDYKELCYLDCLLNFGASILISTPQQLTQLMNRFDHIISNKEMVLKSRSGFRKAIIDCMGYTTLRSVFYPKIFQKLGIKSCVYCNSSLTVVVEKEYVSKNSSKLQAKFQLDHFIPKKEYPCLSISIFNLYPVCSNCNISKGVKKVFFDLYKDGRVHISPFKFKLGNGSCAKFLLSNNLDDISIEFEEPKARRGCSKFSDIFLIKPIYLTQRDVVAELILKAQAYPNSYRSILLKTLPSIFHSEAIITRLVCGNYVEEWEIHKRPLSKLTLDIAHQIGLIKNT